MTPILKSYLKRLTNLSSRNKSLLLLKDSLEQFIDLNQFDFVNGKKSYDIINQIVADKKSIYLIDEIDPRYEKVNELSKRLRRIARTEKFIEQERGSEDLYVGYPFVQGKLLEGTVVRCPLLFFPVTLKLEKQKWVIVKRENEPVSFNRSFLLAYSYFNNAKVNDEFLEKTFEDFSKDSLEFRTQLYEFLKDSPLILNFNQELFTDSLQNFEKLLKSDLEQTEKNGELKLHQKAVLGIFPQAGSFLVPDYEFLIANSLNSVDSLDSDESKNSVESGEEIEFSQSSESPELIKKKVNELAEIFASKAKIIDLEAVKEEKIMAPFAMDASQELAIRKINAGHSMVIQGPPGTGKSQLICNLIADFAAAGKKVLVVCQKRAALDVVHQRLSTVGFQHFTALIHDFKNDRKAVFNQIADQIGLVDEYKKKNLSLDALWLEQDFNQTSRQIDRLAKELDSFKTALFDTDECGISVKTLYLSSNPNSSNIDLSTNYKLFNQKAKIEFASQLKVYSKYAEKMVKLDDFWQNRVDFKQFQQQDLISAKKMLVEFPAEAEKLMNFFQENFHQKLNWKTILQLKSEIEEIKSVENTLESDEIWKLVVYLKLEKINKTNLNELEQKEQELYSIFTQEGIETLLYESEFEQHAKYVKEAHFSQQNFLASALYNLFSSEKIAVKSLLAKYNLPFTEVGIQTLYRKIDNREKLINYLNNNILLFENKEIGKLRKHDLAFFQNHFLNLKKAKIAFDKLTDLKGIDFNYLLNDDFSNVKSKLKKSVNLLQNFLRNQTVYEKYLTPNQLNYLLENQDYADSASKDLDVNFDIFYESDLLKANFSHTELAVIKLLLEKKGEDINTLFENSINLAWIAHIEEKYPILRSVSSLKMEQMEMDLQEKILHKQSLSQQILLIKAREHTYNGLEYNRLRNLTTYRELLHQTTKKKKLWSIRQLFGSYSDEIFDLVPCWLASPETVSAVFPMMPFFDLVIFDEASQCYAESGIPAIYRGKQAVITGDSKQLQPSDLYAVRFEDEADEQPELEVNSLLDLAIQYLPQTQLNGHYRSQSIDLIDFSNKHFYKNKLQILPHFEHINRVESNIKFIKVDGIFQENVNIAEANEVVALVKNLKNYQPEKSIGIVTFNYRQQSLIQDLLESEADILETNAENLFVKNIENVQGDERDIIIFSIGYGPDSKGKVRIQFGSLNQSGGENRLNVAITRARFQIYMVTSIFPNQLHVEDTLNDGPKLLKKYMEYVQLVSESKFVSQNTVNEDTNYGKSLKFEMQKANSKLLNELPFSDLVEKNEDVFESLYLTDDNLFFQSLSAKEAHAYWPINFNKKAWKFQKFYSREFWKNQI
jgi:superfamily I DNA and/or RNA helicase